MNVLPAVWQLVLGFLGGGAFLAVVNGIFARRQTRATAEKTNADAESVSVATANSLLAGMRQDLTDMRTRLVDMDNRLSHAEDLVDAYRRRVEYLTDLLRRNAIQVDDWSAPR